MKFHIIYFRYKYKDKRVGVMQIFEDKREKSLERATELKDIATEYTKAKQNIKTGFTEKEKIHQRKLKILKILNAKEEDWQDYKWQLKNRISDVETLSKIIELSEKEQSIIKAVSEQYRWRVSPYYLSLIDPDDKLDPIKLMSIPMSAELNDLTGELDPMKEEYTNPAGSITRRYPDRLIINVTNECPMYCRFCQRRRNIGSEDKTTSMSVIDESIEYIKNNPEIRDVLITGGDSLILSDSLLEEIIKKLREISHVEIIRLGTRTLVTMPQRITENLCNMLKKYHPIYVNTHFNSPIEVTDEAKAACDKLANAGIPLGNQTVLLNGINNQKYVMKVLNHELLKCRVKPYYIFYPKNVIGTTHFCTSIDEGLEIMKDLRGHTSGLAIPTFIVNAPDGRGKIPLVGDNIIDINEEHAILKTWEGVIVKIKNHKKADLSSYLT